MLNNKDVVISLIDKGEISQRLHLYEVGIHNRIDKNSFTDDEIENISQKIKEEFIKILKNAE